AGLTASNYAISAARRTEWEGAEPRIAQAAQPPAVHRQWTRGAKKTRWHSPGRSATPASDEIPSTRVAGLRPRAQGVLLPALQRILGAAALGRISANQRASPGCARRVPIECGNDR